MKSAEDPRYFPQLTGVRAMAAFMVYLFHFNPFASKFFPPFVNSFFHEFHIGVNLFFVLSGFLICYRYYDSYLFNRKWFYGFTVRRVARIYPVYLLITTVTFIAFYFQNKFEFNSLIAQYILNITFLRGFFEGLHFSGVVQGWSLTVEECFYFSAPLIFLFSKRMKLYVQPIMLLLTGIILVLIFRQIPFHGFFGSMRFMLGYTFFGRCIEFYCGIYLALHYKKRQNNSIENKNSNSLYTILGMGSIILCMSVFAWVGEFSFASGNIKEVGLLINDLFMPFGIALFFWGLLTEHSLIRRVLSTPIFDLLGKSSYVFYLIHMGVIQQLVVHTIPGSALIKKALAFVVLNILSILIYKLIESPMNKWIKKSALPKKQSMLS